MRREPVQLELEEYLLDGETKEDDEAPESEELSEDGEPDSQEEPSGESNARWNPPVASRNVF